MSVKRPVKVNRDPVHARVSIHYLKPDPDSPLRVQVFLSPNRKHMRTCVIEYTGPDGFSEHTAGLVRSYHSKFNGNPVVRPGQIIAKMFLNAEDLREHGIEILSHECGHAAMAFARIRESNLADMEGEEVMCYALGRMANQLNLICHARGVWG